MKRLIKAKWYDVFLPVGKQLKSQLETKFPNCNWEILEYDKFNFTCSLEGIFAYQYNNTNIDIKFTIEIFDINTFGNNWIEEQHEININGIINKTINGQSETIYNENKSVNTFGELYRFIESCLNTPIQI